LEGFELIKGVHLDTVSFDMERDLITPSSFFLVTGLSHLLIRSKGLSISITIRLAVHPGPPPKLLRNKEYEALWRAYWVDMLLLDPKAVVTATMVLERPDGKSERFYCTVSATEVVKSHPGHHLSSSPPL
ncbi:unnamed protein product, partial [Brassica oleracea var. botrytis]